jgi:hypothetical protein
MRGLLTAIVSLSLTVGCSESPDSEETGGTAGNTTSGAPSGGGSSNGGGGQWSGGRNGGNGGRAGGSAGTSNGGSSSAGTSNGGSSSAGMSSGMAGSGSTNDMYGDARTRCVDRTNELRATKGLAPIPRLAKAEPCVDGQAKKDSETGEAHSAFDDCLDQVDWKGAGQNECPGYDSVEDALGGCLDAMWAEGPGGGHYDNMVGKSTHTACGFYTTPGGEVWMIQDFWTE